MSVSFVHESVKNGKCIACREIPDDKGVYLTLVSDSTGSVLAMMCASHCKVEETIWDTESLRGLLTKLEKRAIARIFDQAKEELSATPSVGTQE